MKTIFYSKDCQFDLTDDEFTSFVDSAGKGKKIWVPRLNVFLSDMFIWAGEKPQPGRRKLHDGGYAVLKNGFWVDEASGAKMDLHYYPYLAKDDEPLKLYENQNQNMFLRS